MLNYHFHEIFIRIFLCFISFMLTFFILLNFIDYVLIWYTKLDLLYNDPFLIYMNKINISFLLSIYINLLYWFYNLYAFFSTGLKFKEKLKLVKLMNIYILVFIAIFIYIFIVYNYILDKNFVQDNLLFNVNNFIFSLKVIILLNFFSPLIFYKKFNRLYLYIFIFIFFNYINLNLDIILFVFFITLAYFEFIKISFNLVY